MADATILYCTEPDGTILFSSEEASSANITIPNDAILYLSMDGYDSTHGVWDMQKNDWVLGPKEAGFMFYKTDDQILSFDFGDGEYTTDFELITDEERQRNYELLYQDAQDNASAQNGDTNQTTDSDTEQSQDSAANQQGFDNEQTQGNNTDSSQELDSQQSPNGSSTPSQSNSSDTDLPEKPADAQNGLSEGEARDRFLTKTYGNVSAEEMDERLINGNVYYHQSSYAQPVSRYWENVRGVTDVTNLIEPLYFTDWKYYDAEDFRDAPAEVLRVAKNEIYSRHGYIFNNQDLQNYFLGCAWYEPKYTPEQFDTSVFNKYEVYNLKLLTALTDM